MKKITSLSLLLFLLSSENLWAHPGHGNAVHVESLLHYLIKPIHSLPFFVGLALIATGVLIWKKSRSQNR